jgi:hypothetical protein
MATPLETTVRIKGKTALALNDLKFTMKAKSIDEVIWRLIKERRV